MKHLAYNLVIAALLVFLPIKATLITVMVLVGVDLITGIIAARKRGESITSSGLKRTVVKALAYEAAIILGFLVQSFLTGDTVPVVKILGGLVGMTELKSVLENLEEITGIPLLKTLIDKISQQERE
jgi:phage-related holin